MRAVIQRVSEGSVTIDSAVNGKIGKGFVILLGIEESDSTEDIDWLCGKIARMRVFSDNEGLMNKSLTDVDGDILLISQFTLHASTKKGNRPSFTRAAKPKIAGPLYQQFITRLEAELDQSIETGQFGASMQVALINDGPVTITIDSKNRE